MLQFPIIIYSFEKITRAMPSSFLVFQKILTSLASPPNMEYLLPPWVLQLIRQLQKLAKRRGHSTPSCKRYIFLGYILGNVEKIWFFHFCRTVIINLSLFYLKTTTSLTYQVLYCWKSCFDQTIFACINQMHWNAWCIFIKCINLAPELYQSWKSNRTKDK